MPLSRISRRMPAMQADSLRPTWASNRFLAEPAKGMWRDVFLALSVAGGSRAGVLLDSTHLKAHHSAAGGKVSAGPTDRFAQSSVALAMPSFDHGAKCGSAFLGHRLLQL